MLPQGSQTWQVLTPGSNARYASTGHIVFGTEGSLRAAAFDLAELTLDGPPVPVATGVMTKPSGAVNFDLAGDGSLVYLSGESGLTTERSVLRVARDGTLTPLAGMPTGDYETLRVSPDGRHLAVALGTPADVWTFDLDRGTFTRVTTDDANDTQPLWSVDGQRVVFVSDRDGPLGLFSKPADGSGTAEWLLSRDESFVVIPETWTPDGRDLLFTDALSGGGLATERGGRANIWALSTDRDGAARTIIELTSNEGHADLSPDGRWLAFHSDLSGRPEIYVDAYPDLGQRTVISTQGGRAPVWSPSGDELFFLSLDGTSIFRVDIGTAPALSIGRPTLVAEGPFLPSLGPERPYDVAADGSSLLIIARPDAAAARGGLEVVFVRRWLNELTALVPTP